MTRWSKIATFIQSLIPRSLHHLWADLMGYFWIPCPLCGEMFGGHEARHTASLWVREYHGKAVCLKCSPRAVRLNTLNYGWTEW